MADTLTVQAIIKVFFYLKQFIRYAAESDCRAFFTCGVYTNYHPRLGGCPVNSVFNPSSQACDQPENVPGCEDYYGPASN